MRSYHDPVQVRSDHDDPQDVHGPGTHGDRDRCGAGGADARTGPPRPRMFIWRGRLYVVGAVLDRWQIRSDWWRTAARDDGSGGMADGARLAATLAPERTIWRVEAAAGRQGGRGVYELACTPTDDPGAPDWTLLRVAD